MRRKGPSKIKYCIIENKNESAVKPAYQFMYEKTENMS